MNRRFPTTTLVGVLLLSACGGDDTSGGNGPPADGGSVDGTTSAPDAALPDAPSDAATDTSAPNPDGSADASSDAGTDAPGDAPSDAAVDAPPDAPPDAHCDSGGEDCLDGIDNNCDGLVDCADPQCQPGFECVAPVPTGWETPGYVAVYAGAAAAPSCPTSAPSSVYTGNRDLAAAAASCSLCSCGSPTGVSCAITGDLDPTTSGVQPMMVQSTTCGGSPSAAAYLSVPTPWSGSCYQGGALPAGQLCNGQPCNQSVVAAAAGATGGTCGASGGALTNAAPSWNTNVAACSTTVQGAGCTGSQTCRPKPPAPFAPHLCIMHTGDVACPSGFTKQSAYGGFDDTRACSTCTCGAPTGVACAATYHLYSDPSVGVCSTQVAVVQGGSCANLAGNPGVYGWSAVVGAPSGGSCAVSGGGAPSGTVTPTTPTTICCP